MKIFSIRNLVNRWQHILCRHLHISANARIDSIVRLGSTNNVQEYSRISGEVITEDGVTFAENSDVRGCVSIGRRSYIGPGTRIYNFTGQRTLIEIGKYVSIGPSVIVYANTHHVSIPSTAFMVSSEINFEWPKLLGPTIIGHDVLIGAHTFLMPGITVGHGAIIGPGSVVSRNVEPYEIILGNPARSIRMRFSEDVVSELLKIRWWDWDDTKIKANAEFFTISLKSAADIKIK